MKKIFTLIAVAMMALGVNAQTNFEANPEGLNPVPAGTVLTDNEFFKATTVFEAGGGSNTRTYTNDITFNNWISLRVDKDPSADNPYGIEKSGSTPIIIDVKKNITFTTHVRTGNNKEVCLFDVATSTKVSGTSAYLQDETSESNYFWSNTWTLEAGKQYVVTERGGTGQLAGFTAVAATTGGDTGGGDTGSGDAGSGDNTGGVTGETSKIVLFYPNGVEGANAIDLQEGFKLAITGSEEKSLSSGNDITVGGSAYKSIKISNGAQNTLTLPEGKVATKITLYSYVNHNESKRNDAIANDKNNTSGHGYRWCYWKEVGGTTYTQETAVLFSTFVDGIRQADNSVTLDETALQNPDAQTFELANLSAVTFTNTGEQPCIVIEVEYGDGSATGINNVTTSTIDVNAPVYNISGQQVSKNYKGIVIMNGKKYINK